ncbi:hypothetical protein [Radiobacillus sp. PE A8.2]|uniref:hypothetical protein n=1 Tax=Radiobacillus sp. PE A8.2 TaxID=3380349 RepID=UPI00388EDB8E
MDCTIEKQLKQMEYNVRQAGKAMLQESKREVAWTDKRCKEIYTKLINYAGGTKIVRKGMQGKAKQLAITSFLKGIEPNYDKFKKSVEIANSKQSKHQK